MPTPTPKFSFLRCPGALDFLHFRGHKKVLIGILAGPSVYVNRKYTGSTVSFFIESFDTALKDATIERFF